MTDLMNAFSMSAETASWLMSVFTLASIFVALPSGLLAQRFGAKRMMIVALGIASAGTLIGAAAGSSIVLIASRAVEGAALTVLTACGPIVVQKCVKPEKIGTAMGIWGIWGCLGSTVAAIVTPTVFETLGFEGLWIAYAALAVLAAVLVAAVIRMPPGSVSVRIREERSNAVAARGEAAKASMGGERRFADSAQPRYREILTRDVVLFFVGFASFNVCLLAILAFVPTILQMQGFDATFSGFVSTMPMLISIVSSPLFGMLSDRIGRCKPLLVLAMSVMGPCTYALYADTGPIMWAAAVIMGLVGMGGVGLFLSGYMKLLPCPKLVSVGMGVMVLVQGIGQFLGTFLVQILLGPDLADWAFAGSVLMVLGILGTASLAACRLR